jgi:hypothetical protein
LRKKFKGENENGAKNISEKKRSGLFPTVRENLPEQSKQEKIVILTSAVSYSVESSLKILAEKNSERFFIAHRFDPTITHLVVPVGHNGVLKQRTMKYLQALVCKFNFFFPLK